MASRYAKRRSQQKLLQDKKKLRVLGYGIIGLLFVGLFAACLFYAGLSLPALSFSPTRPQHFDFYTLLPGRKEPFGAQYIVQVGSFRQQAKANALKAQLALLGFEACVQVKIDQGVTWYRVYLGPFADKAKAVKKQQQLAKSHRSLVLKIGV